MSLKYFAIYAATFLFLANLTAQNNCPVKFGKITPQDFNIQAAEVDTTSGAVILADVGSSSFEANNKGWFCLVYKHECRIKITNKSGFDLANVEIPLYISTKDYSEEKLDRLKAYSYNLENGQVVETKLKEDAIFKDKKDANHVVKKFTMPAVKEGTIIEYSYTVVSNFLFNLQDWSFQGNYPCLWSEYKVDLPEFFEYVFLSQGYRAYDIKTTISSLGIFNVRRQVNGGASSDDNFTLKGNVNRTRWVMKNVTALKEEPYTSSLRNHLSKVEFQLSGYRFPDQPYEAVMSNWQKVSQSLFEDEQFGADINRNNNWLNDTEKQITQAATNDLDKAKNIYYYVKNNFKNLGTRGIYLTKTIKEIFNAKSGYANEINLLLVAMLQYKNIKASPIILSTVWHGYTNEYYPLLQRYNYVIVKLTIDNINYYLDASQPYLGFNKLAPYCYNGHARIIDKKESSAVFFYADSLAESKVTSVMLFNDEKQAGKWVGNICVNYGYIESSNTRRNMLENGKQAVEKNFKEGYTGEFEVDNLEWQNIDSCEKTVGLKCDFSIEGSDKSKIIYFNPMIRNGIGKNPFRAIEREYPVEMPYKINEAYTLYMQIPAGYEVDEMPKSVRVKFNDDEGVFEYIISKTDAEINISCLIKFNKALFMPEDYEALRNFYDYILKKQAENIVFKKKN